MFRMYYISTVAPSVTSDDFEDILEKARRNNAKLGVTGLLVVKDNNFAQALEGEKEDVLALYEKIKRDKRHLRIVLISQQEVDASNFLKLGNGFLRSKRLTDTSRQSTWRIPSM